MDPLDPPTPMRIHKQPSKVLDKSFPYWKGKTAERVMSRRVKQYDKKKRMAMLARRQKALARKRGH